MLLIENNNNTDPQINLAIEEYVFRNLDVNDGCLFLYINNPCIIIGRNQNPFIEINPRFLHQKEIPVVRRISGGGTVYHDLGNLSFSFIRKFESNMFNKYREFILPIIELLAEFGISASLDERNNIRIDGKKISGNAQFTNRKIMLSHGTLLFSSDLEKLDKVLSKRVESIQSKSTLSIRSKVVNISDYMQPGIDIFEFKEKLITKIMGSGNPQKLILTPQQWEEIIKLSDKKYRTWEWNYGETPPFNYSKKITIDNQEITICVEVTDGIIDSLNTSEGVIPIDVSLLFNSFIGCRFRDDDILAVVDEFGDKIPSVMNHSTILKLFDFLPGIKEIISNQ